MCIDIDLLAYFAEHGTSATLSHFRISKFELIAKMEEIEKKLHIKLIEHSNFSEINRTNACLKLLPSVKKSIEILQFHCNTFSEEENDNLSLGISSDSSSTWAMDCVKNFNKIHPGLRLTVLADERLTDAMVANSSIIFWCISENELPEFKKHWYIEYEYCLFASDKYLQEHGAPTATNINDHIVIAYSGEDTNFDYRGSNWHISGNYGLPPISPKILVSSREMVSRLVADGVGIGSVCNSQDLYYGLGRLVRVFSYITGPKIKNFFVAKKNASAQEACNVDLIDSLFQNTLKKKNIKINYIS